MIEIDTTTYLIALGVILAAAVLILIVRRASKRLRDLWKELS